MDVWRDAIEKLEKKAVAANWHGKQKNSVIRRLGFDV
jgi:hypothetical protein